MSVGLVAQECGGHVDAWGMALKRYDFRLCPALAKAWSRRGRLGDVLGRHDLAVAIDSGAHRHRPNFADAFDNRGLAWIPYPS